VVLEFSMSECLKKQTGFGNDTVKEVDFYVDSKALSWLFPVEKPP
jgi:hypothetical protein